MLERQDVANVRAAKLVDALVVVSHDAEVAVAPGQLLDHDVLRPVRVLVLVDHDVGEALLVSLEHVLVLFEQAHRPKQEVIEVEGMVLLEDGLVANARLRGQLLEMRAGGARLRGRAQQLILGPGDRFHDGPRWIALGVESHLVHDLFDGREPVSLVIDDEPPVDPGRAAVPPQDPSSDCMERSHPDAACGQVEQLLDPRAHLPGRLVGEGDGQNLVWLGATLLNQPGDPVGKDACLAAARSGEDEEGAVVSGDRCSLRRVKTGQQVNAGRRRRG